MKVISCIFLFLLFFYSSCSTENLNNQILKLEEQAKKLDFESKEFTIKESQKEDVVIFGKKYNLQSKQFLKDGQIQIIKQTYYGEEIKIRDYYFLNNLPFYIRYTTEYYNQESNSTPTVFEKSAEVTDSYFFENGKLIAMRLAREKQLITDEKRLREQEIFLRKDIDFARE